MSTARRPEPFRPPHGDECVICRLCLARGDIVHDVVHDRATCPGCLRAAVPDHDAYPKADTSATTLGTWLAAALGIALVAVVFVVALSLIAGNTLSVLAR